MASFNQFIQSFSDKRNTKGDQFEYFVKKFLKRNPYWKSKVKTIWPCKEAPINWGTNIGTDLIFEDYDGKYWAVLNAQRTMRRHLYSKGLHIIRDCQTCHS